MSFNLKYCCYNPRTMSKAVVLKRSKKRAYISYVITGILFILSLLFAFLFFNQEDDSSSPYGICYLLIDIFFFFCLAFSVYSTLQKKEVRIAKEEDFLLIEERKVHRIPLSSLESISYKDGGKFFSNGNLTFHMGREKIQVKNIVNAKANYLALREILALKAA